jgi:nitrogen fixation/metabolism regulation signal transduction histidine kinase
MRFRKPQNLSTKTLYSAILLYVLIIILFLFFTDQILKDINSITFSTIPVIIPVAVLMPLLLFIFIIYYLIKLRNLRKKNYPGVRLKSKLILFFTIIIIFSAIPQTILSIKFINVSSQKWFDDKLGLALESGVDIALDYYRSYIQDLQDINSSQEFSVIIIKYFSDPTSLWTTLKELNHTISSIQISSNEANSFFGDSSCLVSDKNFANLNEGIQPKRSSNGIEILSLFKKYTIEGTDFKILISLRIPESFSTNTSRLTLSVEQFKQFQEFQEIFPFYVLFIYLFFAIPLIFLSVLSAFTLSEDVTVPIERLEKATKRVADGDYSFRIISPSNDELAILISSFNQMINELELSRIKILQTEKVTTWQEIAQRLAHEIRNPLTPIKLSAQRVLRKKESENIIEIIDSSMALIIKEVETLDSMLQQFRNFARLPKIEPVSVKLFNLIDDSINIYADTFSSINFELLPIDDKILVNVDKNQMKQVFINLFKNSIEAMNNKGTIKIRTDIIVKGYTQYCRIQIQDEGIGISSENAAKVFHPYFTTKTNGTGLGLSIIERIVFDHKGRIWLESKEGYGTTFYIDIPIEVDK